MSIAPKSSERSLHHRPQLRLVRDADSPSPASEEESAAMQARIEEQSPYVLVVETNPLTRAIVPANMDTATA